LNLKKHLEKHLFYIEILIPFVIAGVITKFWHSFLMPYFAINIEDPEIMSAMSGGFLIFSVIMPSIALGNVIKQVGEMIEAFDNNNYQKFKTAHRKRIPGIIHGINVFLSLLAIIPATMMSYRLFITGFFFVFGISAIHSFFIFATIKLDNPPKLLLLKLGITPEWLERLEVDSVKMKEKINQ